MSYIWPLVRNPSITFKVLPRVGGGGGTGDLTGEQILALLQAVDGPSSGLDADTVDGQHASYFASLAALQAEIARAVAAEGLLAPKNSPAFTGSPTTTDPSPGANNNQIPTTAWVQALVGGGGGGGGSLPILTPEQFGADPDGGAAAAAVTTAAFADMMDAAEAAGGAIIWLLGRYFINAPIVFPANNLPMSMMGMGRGGNVNGLSTIIGAGNHDLIKFPYNTSAAYFSNFTIGHEDSTTPTGNKVAIDCRWLQDSKFENVGFYNLNNGIDTGVGRGIVIDGCYIRGLNATGSGIGSDAYGRDCGFGILVRSNQTLLDGNVGKETLFYDREGSGVTIQPKAKGTNLRLRNCFISAKTIGDDDDAGGITEEYNPDVIALDIMGASTIRVENCQLRQSRHAIRLRHAPNFEDREAADALKVETGKQMCAGNIFINITSEACLQTFNFGGYEKLYAIMLQANGCATTGYDVGDNPNDTFPGFATFPAGTTPVDKFGGAGLFAFCNALTCREQGFLVRSGINRFVEPAVAGYSGNRDGDTDPGSEALFTTTAGASNRVAYVPAALGTYVVINKGSNPFWVRSGNSSVVAAASGPSVLVGANSFITITRSTGDTHLAYFGVTGASDGEVGRPAVLLSEGFLIKSTSVNGTWINGGIISSNKSLKDVSNIDDQGVSCKIENNADKVFIDGLDVAEGGFLNSSTGKTDIQVTNLKRSTYRYDPYSAVGIRDVSTTTATFALADMDNYVRQSGSSSTVFTVPPNASVPFPLGAVLNVIRGGSGTLTMAPGAGVTIRSENGNLSVPTRHQRGVLVQHAINDWTFFAVVPTAAGAGSVDWTAVLNKPSTFPFDPATQAEAEAGVENTKGMTPLRTAQAIAALATGGGGGVPTTRNLTAAGLVTGGGTLAADRTFTVTAASQAEAEAGSASTVAMTPQRTAQAIAALLGGIIAAFTGKTTPVDADTFAISDSAASGAPKKLTLANLKATLVTYLNSTSVLTAFQAAGSYVLGTRSIGVSGLATGGGDLSADRTIGVPAASQAEAEAGSDNTKAMTPLRTAQAITALGGGGGGGEANTIASVGVAGSSIVSGKVGVQLQMKGVDGGGLVTDSSNSTDVTLTVSEASQAEAEAGTSSTVVLTPRRWVQAFLALFGPQTHLMTAKTSPVAADEIAIADSAATYASKRSTLANLASYLNSTSVLTAFQAAGSYVLTTRSVATSGLLSGGGDLSADRTITVAEASQAEAEAGTSGTVVLTPRRFVQALNVLLGIRINGATAKTTPVGGDELVISDSAASSATKKLTITNLFGQLLTIASSLIATTSNIWTGTSDAVLVTPNGLNDADEFIVVTPSAGTSTPNQNAGRNFEIPLSAGANTLALMSNLKNGRGGIIMTINNAAGSTLTSSAYLRPDAGAAPAHDSAANAVNIYGYQTNRAGTAVYLWLVGPTFS